MTERIAKSMQDAISYLTEHPDEARYTDSPATATLDSGLLFRVEGPDGATIISDMPDSVGGTGSAPSPGWFMRAALAACDATLIAMRAAQEGVLLRQLEVQVDSESDDRGILGMDDAVPAGPLSARVKVKLSSNASEEQLRKIVLWAHDHCPVSDAIGRAIPMTVEVEAV
ncbi:MAG: OsmC family protein [Actinomycetota bacterium]